jgi:UDP-N-acetyl-D-galactosamine dehydrogenase
MTGVQAGETVMQPRIGVVGLGYVGLPLAIAFARKFEVVGFDVSAHRIATLRDHHDYTGEVSTQDLAASRLVLTDDPAQLGTCPVIIVTVPTPVDEPPPRFHPRSHGLRDIGQGDRARHGDRL